ncbi:hypothetical protein MASR2M79_25920 [Aminivibrio sp.]
MKVKLDLRPRYLLESSRKKLNAARVLLVSLLLAFFLVGGTTLGLSFMKVRSMNSEVAMVSDQVAIQKAQNRKMANEIKRLSEVEAVYTSALKLLKDELPALEFVNAVEAALPLGVWLESLTINPGKAILRGKAWVESDVVEFAKGLLDSGVVATVDFPVTTRIEKDKESMVDFTLSCLLRDIATVADNAGRKGGTAQ